MTESTKMYSLYAPIPFLGINDSFRKSSLLSCRLLADHPKRSGKKLFQEILEERCPWRCDDGKQAQGRKILNSGTSFWLGGVRPGQASSRRCHRNSSCNYNQQLGSGPVADMSLGAGECARQEAPVLGREAMWTTLRLHDDQKGLQTLHCGDAL